MVTLIVIFFFLIAVVFDYLPSRRDRSTKERVLYWSFLSVGILILILYSFIIIVPGPTQVIEYVVGKIFLKSSG